MSDETNPWEELGDEFNEGGAEIDARIDAMEDADSALTRHHDPIDDLTMQRDALEAENERLREALRTALDHFKSWHDSCSCDDSECAIAVAGDLFLASLSETEGEAE